MSAFVIARTALQIIKSAFLRNQNSPHQCFRIKNLQDEEIRVLVGLWDKEAPGTSIDSVSLVVAEDIAGGIPARHIASQGRSITYYRNHNDTGLVYLETKVQSDEQGLQNLFTLRDSNFLDRSFDDYAGMVGGVPALMLSSAWVEVSQDHGNVPALLMDRVLQIVKLIPPEVAPVPVRRFAAFSLAACKAWKASAQARDAAVADRLIGGCLHELGMFPDTCWRQTGIDARVKRRLELNARHAELVSGGSELEPEEIARLARNTEFVDESRIPLGAADCRKFAALCEQYALMPTDQLRSEIPYTIFEQLFQKDSAGLKLGERVRAEIENTAPSRLPELDALDVVQGLDSKLQADAERLLAAQPPQGLLPLPDLLASRTRKAIERAAAPPAARFANPLIQLVRTIRQLQAQDDGVQLAKVHVKCSDDDARASATRGLFAFLFGPTLKSLVDSTRGVAGACELSVDPDLIDQCQVPGLVQEREEGDDESEAQGPISWPTLSLSISVRDEAGRLIECQDRVEWAPDNLPFLALFWLLVAAEDSPCWRSIGELRMPDGGASDGWVTTLIQRDQSLALIEDVGATIDRGANPAIDEFLQSRQQLREALRGAGLSVEALNDLTDAWQVAIGSVRVDHVPQGTRPRVLEAMLGSDMLAFSGNDRRLMLPTHPLRMRWISCYLSRCLQLAASCMTGVATFATGGGEQYLDWLESLSPHESPPTAAGKAGEILHARSEAAWFEDFAPLVRLSADVSVDQQALASIGARILDYIDAHPFKQDGLSLLLLLPASDRMPAQLIELIARGQYADLRISLTVAAPKARWESIARFVEALPGEERKSGRGRLFPARDLAFIDFDQGADLATALGGESFDISVVTHVLQESVISQQNTEPPVVGRPGRFDPVMDRPIRLESSGSGGGVSIVMLPRAPDTALETWGTLVVRANRSCPVSPSQPENVDFVELRINFQDSARVFHALHLASHWVITLERHISREQIESEEAGAPDVLSMETGVGSNGLSTLIVSSHSGRALIEARIAKKLRKLVPDVKDPRRASGLLEELAARVYEETRKLSPHLALQAMGVARVTEEILGLCMARRLADEECHGSVTNGVLAWISLDEHTNWFGGATNIRADMCRVIIERNDAGMLDVDLLVLEGKFRQNFDPHGVTQVSQTSAFLSRILAGATADGSQRVDAELWRERFLSAIESVAVEAIRVVPDDVSGTSEGARTVPADIRQMFREGRYQLRSVKGLYSICLWENSDDSVVREHSESLTIVRSSRAHVLDLISRADLGVDVRGALDEATTYVADREPIPETVAPTSGLSGGMVPGLPGPTAAANKTEEASSDAAPAAAHGVGSEVVSPTSASAAPKGLGLSELGAIYDEILGCFASHNVPVAAASPNDQPIIEGPASILFKVRAGSGVDPRKLFEKAQALKLQLALEQDQNVTFDIDRGYVTIDVPKKPGQRYYVNAADLWARWERPLDQLSVPLGVDRYGEPVVINFSSSNSPHLLVAGTTGSGKSEALNTMLFGLVRFYGPHELRLMLVDPKGTELAPFEKSAHLLGRIGFEDIDALELLKTAVQEMQRRYEQFRLVERCRSLSEFNSSVADEKRLPWWVIVLDEYADLTSDPALKKEIEHELKRLAQKARAAGIHVVIATQKPSADVISTNLRSNLPAQLALRVKSGTESRVVLDEAGAENLNGKGDGLLKADGKLVRVQCAQVAKEDQNP